MELRARRLLSELDHVVLGSGAKSEAGSQEAVERHLVLCKVRATPPPPRMLLVAKGGRPVPITPLPMLPRPSGGVVSFSCCDGLVYLLGYTGSV